MYLNFWMILVLALSYAEAKPFTEHQIALVTEINQPDNKRSLELFPDTLDVEIRTDDATQTLHLKKQKSLNARTIPVEYDVPELNQRNFKLSKDVAYYQDMRYMAPIQVEAVYKDGVIKRTLTGGMLHNRKAYEIHPGTKFLHSVTEVLKQRGLGSEHTHSVHVLKEVNLQDYLKTNQYDVLTPKQKQDLEHMKKKHTEEDTLASFLHSIEDQTKQTDSGRSKRYASHSTTKFHIEMLFLVDYSAYNYWMQRHDNDAEKVHEELVHYYVHIFNGINMAYGGIDYEKHNIAITLWLVKIHFITVADNEVAVPTNKQADFDDVKLKVDDFLNKHNYTWSFPDHTVFWTKTDMFSGSTNVLGVSLLCGLCQPGQALSVNEDNGFFSFVTAAHEVGHNFGSDHDGQGDNHCPIDDVYIMYFTEYILSSEFVHTAFKFSDCSVDQFKQCFTGKHRAKQDWPLVCTYDTVCEHNVPVNEVDDLPGEKYSLTEQCQLFVHPESSYEPCEKRVPNFCEKLECYLPTEDMCTAYFAEFRAALGTPCEYRQGNPQCTGETCACYNGVCTDRDRIPSHKDEQDPSCSEVIYTPPNGCENSYDDCDFIIKNYPWNCFITDDVKTKCKASCYRDGLFYVEDPPCTLPTDSGEDSSSVPEGPIMTTDPNDIGTVQFCQQNLVDQDGMTCPHDVGYCIPVSWFCDGDNDCFDNSDENPDICRQVPCYAERDQGPYLRCKDLTCVNVQDGASHCPDGSDEDCDWLEQAPKYCYNIFEGSRGYNCPNNHTKCINSSQVCDGINDDCDTTEGEIGDESEIFCDLLECGMHGLRCPNPEGDHGLHCIPRSWACDEEPDCFQGIDEDIDWCEANEIPDCNVGKVLCPGQSRYQCVDLSSACNLNDDCESGRDEEVAWCEAVLNEAPSCAEGYAACPLATMHECIPQESLCDGIEQCSEGGDENLLFCLRQNCSSGEIQCPDELDQEICIVHEFLCDGYDDCKDGGEEDLEFCNALGIEPYCYYHEYSPCPYQVQGKFICLPPKSFCDGTPDCSNGEDENSTLCNEGSIGDSCEDQGKIQCPNSDECISFDYACDGENDCVDGAEEDLSFCNEIGRDPMCYLDDYYTCPNTDGRFTCISILNLCDMVKDCIGGEDEAGEMCGDMGSGGSCGESEVFCPLPEHEYYCIPLLYACDGKPDCAGNSDENQTWCDSLLSSACFENEFQCEQNSHRCIPLEYKCDFEYDCLDGSDERNCNDTPMSIGDGVANLTLGSNIAEKKQHSKRRESRMKKYDTKIKGEKNVDTTQRLLKTKTTQLRKEKKIRAVETFHDKMHGRG